MVQLPAPFLERMKEQLKDEFPSFLASYEEPRLRGLRVNTAKLSPEEFLRIAPFPLQPVPWVKDGFFYGNDVRPADHPFYAAGLYYLQEPSAMTPASRLPVRPGDRVLDLCAAPGGKATALAARLAGTGLLVANDASASRAKALLRNLELFGTRRMLVTADLPKDLSPVFPAYFDCVNVDAPCSGEGMFRKSPEVAETWSPARVAAFAATQRAMLAEAHAMLREGGHLMYSTCTFSPEENEQTIAWFLKAFPDMRLLPIAPYEGFAPGRPDWADGNPALTRCVRIWPHRMPGEGHFLALLQKGAGDPATDQSALCAPPATATARLAACILVAAAPAAAGSAPKKTKKERGPGRQGSAGRATANRAARTDSAPSAEETAQLCALLRPGAATCFAPQADLSGAPTAPAAASPESAAAHAPSFTLEARSGRAYLTEPLPPAAARLHFLRSGMYLGEWKKNRFEPSEALALALTPGEASQRLSLSPDDPRLTAYLRGETLLLTEADLAQLPADASGWLLLCAGGYPLAWAKRVGATLKNKYPAAWRK